MQLEGVFLQNCEGLLEGFCGFLAVSSAAAFRRFLEQLEGVFLQNCKGLLEGIFGFLAESSAEAFRRFFGQKSQGQ